MPDRPSLKSLLREHWILAGQLRKTRITFQPRDCTACGLCAVVCPIGCWDLPDNAPSASFTDRGCVACGACLTQCPTRCVSLTPRAPS